MAVQRGSMAISYNLDANGSRWTAKDAAYYICAYSKNCGTVRSAVLRLERNGFNKK